jgi:hypothetical protein
MEGFLFKKALGESTFGRHNWKLRWFVLESTSLSYFESFDTSDNKPCDVKGIYPTNNCSVSDAEHPEFKHAFVVQHPSKNPLILAAETANLKNMWVRAIRDSSKLDPGEFVGKENPAKYMAALGIVGKDPRVARSLSSVDEAELNSVFKFKALQNDPQHGGKQEDFDKIHKAYDTLVQLKRYREEDKKHVLVHYSASIQKGPPGEGFGMVVNVDERHNIYVKKVLDCIVMTDATHNAHGEVRVGDEILGIDGESTNGWTLARLVQRLNDFRVPVDSSVNIMFQRRIRIGNVELDDIEGEEDIKNVKAAKKRGPPKDETSTPAIPKSKNLVPDVLPGKSKGMDKRLTSLPGAVSRDPQELPSSSPRTVNLTEGPSPTSSSAPNLPVNPPPPVAAAPVLKDSDDDAGMLKSDDEHDEALPVPPSETSDASDDDLDDEFNPSLPVHAAPAASDDDLDDEFNPPAPVHAGPAAAAAASDDDLDDEYNPPSPVHAVPAAAAAAAPEPAAASEDDLDDEFNPPSPVHAAPAAAAPPPPAQDESSSPEPSPGPNRETRTPTRIYPPEDLAAAAEKFLALHDEQPVEMKKSEVAALNDEVQFLKKQLDEMTALKEQYERDLKSTLVNTEKYFVTASHLNDATQAMDGGTTDEWVVPEKLDLNDISAAEKLIAVEHRLLKLGLRVEENPAEQGTRYEDLQLPQSLKDSHPYEEDIFDAPDAPAHAVPSYLNHNDRSGVGPMEMSQGGDDGYSFWNSEEHGHGDDQGEVEDEHHSRRLGRLSFHLSEAKDQEFNSNLDADSKELMSEHEIKSWEETATARHGQQSTAEHLIDKYGDPDESRKHTFTVSVAWGQSPEAKAAADERRQINKKFGDGKTYENPFMKRLSPTLNLAAKEGFSKTVRMNAGMDSAVTSLFGAVTSPRAVTAKDRIRIREELDPMRPARRGRARSPVRRQGSGVGAGALSGSCNLSASGETDAAAAASRVRSLSPTLAQSMFAPKVKDRDVIKYETLVRKNDEKRKKNEARLATHTPSRRLKVEDKVGLKKLFDKRATLA